MSNSKKEASVYIARVHATGSAGTEQVEIVNQGTAPADVSLWSLAASNGQKVSLPEGLVLWPAQRITVYTGDVLPVTGGVTFASQTALWSERGDTARLYRADGKQVASYRYAARQPGATITHVKADGEEHVEIDNLDSHAIDLSGWKLEAEGGRKSFVFPAGATLAPHARLRVYTNRHEPESGGFSFGSKQPVWNNDGAVARLHDRDGGLRSAYAYGGRAAPDGADVAIATGMADTPAAHLPAGPKAILIGLNYKDSPLEMLRGAQRDLIEMFGLLTRDLGYDPRNVAVLTDDATTATTLQKPFLAPTCESVEALIGGWSAQAGEKDSLFLHFSGHGMQVKDEDGDEEDGLDEALLLSDRPLVDDRLLQVLTGPLTQDARVFALIDSCHCGTVLDLTHTMGTDGKVTSSARRAPHRGIVTCLAASDDAEEAADARSAEGFVGVLSYAFRKVLKANPKGLTYRGLLGKVSELFGQGKLAQSPKLSFNVEGFNVDQPLPFLYAGPAEPITGADVVFTEVAARGCYPHQCCCPPPWSGCGGCCPPPPPPCCGPCYTSCCYPRPSCCGRYC